MTLDVELRSLHCIAANYTTFEPKDGFDSFPSPVNLTLQSGAPVAANFLTPAVLPFLRLFCARDLALHHGLDRLTLTNPSTRYAASLHHLSLVNTSDDVIHLLLSTHRLRSLDLSFFDPLVFPSDFRFATPLIAVRMWVCDDRNLVGFTGKDGRGRIGRLENGRFPAVFEREPCCWCCSQRVVPIAWDEAGAG